jgi:hypothetical protein
MTSRRVAYVVLVLVVLVGLGRLATSALRTRVVPPGPIPVRGPETHDVPLPPRWEERPATAALHAVLQGYGIAVVADALDHECDVGEEGASIDDLEKAANAHGLNAEQVILPADYVLLPEAATVPSLYVGVTPEGVKEFGVIWREDGGRVSVFRPSSGPVDLSATDFTASLFIHEMPIPRAVWAQWATSPEFTSLLSARMRALGLPTFQITKLLHEISRDDDATKHTALDAALRAIPTGSADPAADAQRFFDCAYTKACAAGVSVREEAWAARPTARAGGIEPQVIVRGAVLVKIRGRVEPTTRQ